MNVGIVNVRMNFLTIGNVSPIYTICSIITAMMSTHFKKSISSVLLTLLLLSINILYMVRNQIPISL